MIGIIFRPLVTEKITKFQEKGIYAFEVDPIANKINIAKAIEKKFNVTVTNVRTMNYQGKPKAQQTRRGKFVGRKSNFKKAIVTLKEGDKIDLFGNV